MQKGTKTDTGCREMDLKQLQEKTPHTEIYRRARLHGTSRRVRHFMRLVERGLKMQEGTKTETGCREMDLKQLQEKTPHTEIYRRARSSSGVHQFIRRG
jgi:hypothetical protein